MVYVLANCVVGMTWSFGIPYLLGMCAEFDQTGQIAALGGFASKMGLASGPMVAALVVGKSMTSAGSINVGALALVLCLVAAMVPAVLAGSRPRERFDAGHLIIHPCQIRPTAAGAAYRESGGIGRRTGFRFQWVTP